MTNPHEREVENMKARVRCPECRTTFHERVQRIIHGDRVVCPTCQEQKAVLGEEEFLRNLSLRVCNATC